MLAWLIVDTQSVVTPYGNIFWLDFVDTLQLITHNVSTELMAFVAFYSLWCV